MAPRVRITVDGRLALTIEQAAERYGLASSSMRAVISRLRIQPAAHLDGDRPDAVRRRGLYMAKELDVVMRSRPGRGANLRRRSTDAGG